MNYIGIDPGMGAIKIWDKMGGTQLPSFVARGGGKRYANMLGTGKRDNAVSVSFAGREYYVGGNAHKLGRAIENMGFDRLTGSPEIQALVYGALTKRMIEHGKYDGPATVFFALPVEMMTDKDAKQNIAAVKKWLKAIHSWTCDGIQYSLVVDDVKVTSQPVGAMFDYVLNDSGKPIADRKSAIRGEIGVISVGFNTVEIMCLEDRAIVDRLTSGTKTGVRRLLRNVDPEALYSLGELDDRLRRGTLDVGVGMPEWVEEITGAIEDTWSDTWRRFESVVVVGGGSMLLNGQLSGYFGGGIYCPDQPVMSIARGLHKFMSGRSKG